MNRLTEAGRGVRDGSWADGPGSERRMLDMLGNWGEFEKDVDGDGAFGGAADSLQEREHNFANEITEITDYADPTDSGSGSDLEFDYTDTGAMQQQDQLDITRSIQALKYTHDAWQRLVKVEFGLDLRTEYEYNGLNWRTVKRADMQESPDGTLTQERVMLYDKDWRIVEEWIDDDLDVSPGIDRIAQQVWGPRYVDDAILRRQSTNLGNDSPNTTWETQHYYLTDALFSPVALVTHTGALAERVGYTPYGVARHHWAHDVSGDGAVTTDPGDPRSDVSLANDALNETIADSGYNVDADVNRDGVVDSTDVNAITAAAAAALPDGLVSDADSGGGGADSPLTLAGYVFNAETKQSHVRHRNLSHALGRWVERDPAVDAKGGNLYLFAQDHIVGVVIGRAPKEPINSCGIEGVIEFPNVFPGDISIEHCCAAHDECYITCGTTQEQCDTEFSNCMVTACLTPPTPPDSGLPCGSIPHTNACLQQASIYTGAVQAWGERYFREAQENCVDPQK